MFSKQKQLTFSGRLLESQKRKACFLKVEYSGIGITNASGSIGGQTASHNRGGQYWRTKVVPVNPQSAAQTAVRNKFGSLSQAWRALTEAQRDAWSAAVGQFQKKGALSKTITLSGINLFKSLNQNLFDIGVATINTPPRPTGATNASSLSFVADASAHTVLLTFAATPIPAGFTWIVFASPQVSPGISFLKNKMVIITTLPAATATGEDVGTEYETRFGALVAGNKVAIGLVGVNNTTGEKTPMIKAETIVVA